MPDPKKVMDAAMRTVMVAKDLDTEKDRAAFLEGLRFGVLLCQGTIGEAVLGLPDE